MDDKLIEIAKITSSSGVKGLVKIKSLADTPESLFKYEGLSIDGQPIILSKSHQLTNGLFVCKIDVSASREQAEALRGKVIYINKSALPNLQDDEHYADELIGFKVLSHNMQELGKVNNISNYGAGDVLEYTSIHQKQLMVPFNEQFIKKIDAAQNQLILEEFKVL